MAVRLSDVASRAGVSVKTVSNVVHGYVHVRSQTRERVQAALDELDYRPNLSARSLRRGQSGLIALAVPALDMPYFSELARAVVEAAGERGWTVLVDQTDGLGDREREVAAGLQGRLIDGLIMSPMALEADDLRPSLRDTPLVLLGERITGGGADHVAVDNVEAARVATNHLIERGRRRIAAIGCQSQAHAASGVASLRRTGYLMALTDADLPATEGWTPDVAGYVRAEGATAMTALLDRPEIPDAVFCFSDLLALGALRVLSQRGVRVPEDIAVIGFDDIEDGRYGTPSLSTIAPDKATIARTAVGMLYDRIARRIELPARDVRVGFELVARESTIGRADPTPANQASAQV
ncbi:MAG: LacI family DNA-binding transcriptional regulator [Nocardioides sp.]